MAAIVRRGYGYGTECSGRFTTVAGPGIAFVIPVVDRIGRDANGMEQLPDIPGQKTISRDAVMMSVDGGLDLQVPEAVEAS